MAISRNSLTCYLSSSIAADGEHGESHSMSDAAFFIDISVIVWLHQLPKSELTSKIWITM